MDNYNPRQNTRMRWKDARELEKFIFLTGHFHFQTEVLENVLEDELYGKLYKELQFCAENITSKGVLITDTYNNALFIGTIFDDNSMQLINFYNNEADIIDINIVTDNELKITKETETFISEDHVKTLFGNQSIIGQGNIDLYRHQLTLTNTDDISVSCIVYSSNNLPIDSPQDFVTVTKADKDYTGHAIYLTASGDINPAFIRYSAGNVIIQLKTGNIKPVKTITDIVTTI
nr:MAG TPA: hypothetical protein [Caudoviricetes sp.]